MIFRRNFEISGGIFRVPLEIFFSSRSFKFPAGFLDFQLDRFCASVLSWISEFRNSSDFFPNSVTLTEFGDRRRRRFDIYQQLVCNLLFVAEIGQRHGIGERPGNITMTKEQLKERLVDLWNQATHS